MAMVGRSTVWLTLLAAGCAAPGLEMSVHGESLVLARTDPANLTFDRVEEGTLVLRSTHSNQGATTVQYEEGVDFVVDYARGTIARTAHSRIPDYSTHPMFGLVDFDQNEFADYGNRKYFVWADYRTSNGRAWTTSPRQGHFLRSSLAKLAAGGAFRIATYGDSITAGGEASQRRFQFGERYAGRLREQFPAAAIELQDFSIPGYSSRQGVDWFDDYLGKANAPDLVLVAFGMNENNLVGFGGMEPEELRDNLVTLVERIRRRWGAEVVLLSSAPPNDRWHYTSHRMAQFAEATRDAALQSGCAFFDVFRIWEGVLLRKDPSSLLGNNINHPNDFGHWLYAESMQDP